MSSNNKATTYADVVSLARYAERAPRPATFAAEIDALTLKRYRYVRFLFPQGPPAMPALPAHSRHDPVAIAAPILPAYRRRGRGAATNASGRFEIARREDFDDGWTRDEAPEPLKTEVTWERPKAIITRNDSPDIPFDRSINPYRGCEHGCFYCFARPTHAYMGLSPGLDFESRL